MELNQVICDNCLEVMNSMPDNSIDAIVTDPPYGLSFMGKKWDYDVPSQEIWEECLRVLKPGGYLLAFAGTRTQHRMAVRIEDAGFEIRDMIAWIYSSGFPKSLNIGKAVDKIQGNERKIVGEQKLMGTARRMKGGNFNDFGGEDTADVVNLTKGTSEWEGWGTALKPALEPITVARKPIEGNVAQNCLKWGVGGINIDGCRVDGGDGNKIRKGGASMKDTNVTNFQGQTKDYTGGRFPANLITDGSDEVVGLFPQSKSTPWPDRKSTGWKQTSEIVNGGGIADSGSAARFFYCAKASKSERNRGCEELGGNKHCTVKPIALMEYLVKLVSKEGHTVLDPFMGSGSTGIACKKLNRNFIGIELDADYCKIAEARINSYKINPIQENLL